MYRQSGPMVVLLAVVLAAGCDSRQPKSDNSGASAGPNIAPSTTQPSAATEPTTAPASQPLSSQLFIDDQPVRFPQARLRVSKSNGHVIARLYSNDPKAAINDDYQGNSYDLVMHLDDIREPQQVYLSQWQFSARSREYVETPYGIFLDGIRHQLQPINVTAKFLGDMTMVRIDLDGQFLQFDSSDPNQPGKPVQVRGSLLAAVEYKD